MPKLYANFRCVVHWGLNVNPAFQRMPAAHSMPLHADLGGRVFSLARSGERLSDLSRTELLTKLRANEYVPPFEMDALVFQQSEGSLNRNFVRFTARGLQRISRSFEGRPFLRDHRQSDSLARGGTIVGSQLVDLDDGSKGIRQTIQLVKPWAQVGVLDGTIDTFSIGFHPNDSGEPTCSVCEGPMFSGDCFHWPGDQVEKKDGTKVTVEAVFSDADGIETSSVPVPAVKGTGIEGIRAALSAFRSEQDPAMFTRLSALRGVGASKEKTMSSFVAIAAILGLAADTAEPQILDVLRANGAKLETALAAQAESRKALETLQSQVAGFQKTEKERDIDALVFHAREGGKIPGQLGADGKPVASPLEIQIRTLAALDLATARLTVENLPRIVAVGELQSTKKIPKLDRNPTQLSVEEKALCARKGITEKSYLASKMEILTAPDEEKE